MSQIDMTAFSMKGFIVIIISEEQKAILNCYSGTKEEVAEELGRAMPFIEDPELRESAYELLEKLSVMSEREYRVSHESILFDASSDEGIAETV